MRFRHGEDSGERVSCGRAVNESVAIVGLPPPRLSRLVSFKGGAKKKLQTRHPCYERLPASGNVPE